MSHSTISLLIFLDLRTALTRDTYHHHGPGHLKKDSISIYTIYQKAASVRHSFFYRFSHKSHGSDTSFYMR
jgi:hypothetical protein